MFLAWRNGKGRLLIVSIAFMATGIFLSLILELMRFEGGASLVGMVTKSGSNYFLAITKRGLVYVPSRSNAMNMFDIVSMDGVVKELSFQHYEGSFSFKEYLRNLGVVGEFDASKIDMVFESHLDMRAYKEWCVSFLSGGEKILCQSVLFFSTPKDLESSSGLDEMGLLSILFSCGIHANFLLGKIGRWLDSKIGVLLSCVATLSISLFLFAISGFGFTGARVWIRQLLLFCFCIRKEKVDGFEMSCLSLLSTLLIFPGYCLEEAFWYPFLFLVCGKLSNPFMKEAKGLRKIFLKMLMSAIVAFPLAMNLNGSYSILSIFLMSLFMAAGKYLYIISIPLCFCPALGYFIEYPCKIFIAIFSIFEEGVKLKISGYMGIGMMVIWFVCYLAISFSKSISFRKMTYVFSSFMMVLAVTPTMSTYLPKYEVHFIDVGQGSSTLVRNGTSNILIDTGGSIYVDLAKECLIPYFEKIGVSRLDYVLLTHGDTDHDGALKSLMDNFAVAKSIYGKDTDESFSIGGVEFKNLNHDPVGDDENSNSGVFQFSVRDKSFLIMGDVPKKVERRMMETYSNLEADVFLVGHHGSKTSSDYDFVKSVNPDLAVISVGEGNRYGHPNEETLSVFSSLGIKVFRTDLSGTLVYHC